MPKVSVRKSIVIDAPLEKVYEFVRNFKEWPAWSPWLITDPECKVSYADDGGQYTWEGDVVGQHIGRTKCFNTTKRQDRWRAGRAPS